MVSWNFRHLVNVRSCSRHFSGAISPRRRMYDRPSDRGGRRCSRSTPRASTTIRASRRRTSSSRPCRTRIGRDDDALPVPAPRRGCRDDRGEHHIAASHPDLLPEYRERLAETIADPDMIRRSRRFADARLLARWFDGFRGGKHVVVVVVTDAGGGRRWVVTAYLARRLAEGGVEWKRS